MYPVRLISDFCRCVTQYQQRISGSTYWQMIHPCHRKEINSLHTLNCVLECCEWHKMLPACTGSVRILRGMRWNIRLGLIWQRTQQWLSTTLRIINSYSSPSGILWQQIADVCNRTGSSVGWASGYHAGDREFNSDRTNTQGLKITEQKVLPY